MGNQVKCRVRFGKQESEGKALLETSEIIFRGDFRLKIPFATILSAKVLGDELQLQTAEGVAIFELGASIAQKWREKILHPKTRIEKLGIKPETKVWLIGFKDKDEEFLKELQTTEAVMTPAKNGLPKECYCILLQTDTKQQLALVAKIARKMLGAVALWIIYPKGRRRILLGGDVFAAGLRQG